MQQTWRTQRAALPMSGPGFSHASHNSLRSTGCRCMSLRQLRAMKCHPQTRPAAPDSTSHAMGHHEVRTCLVQGVQQVASEPQATCKTFTHRLSTLASVCQATACWKLSQSGWLSRSSVATYRRTRSSTSSGRSPICRNNGASFASDYSDEGFDSGYIAYAALRQAELATDCAHAQQGTHPTGLCCGACAQRCTE